VRPALKNSPKLFGAGEFDLHPFQTRTLQQAQIDLEVQHKLKVGLEF
jgi:hypothetical protein